MKRKKVFIEILLSIVGVVCTYFASFGWLGLSFSGIARHNWQRPPLDFFPVLTYCLQSLIPSVSWFFARWLFYRRGVVNETYRLVTNILIGCYAGVWALGYVVGVVQDFMYWYIYLECIVAIVCFSSGILLDVMLTKYFSTSHRE